MLSLHFSIAKIKNKLYTLVFKYLINANKDSMELTCRPDTSGLRETHFQSLVSYAIIRHLLHTRAI